MGTDDIIYVICLLSCIGAGNYVKQIRNEKQRQAVSTALGLLMVFIVSGFYSLHCLLSVLMGALTTLYIHPSCCHLVTFVVMFGYLTFFRTTYLFGLSTPPGHTNMIQMILTLKVAGIAFEKNSFWKKQKNKSTDSVSSEEEFDFRTLDIFEIFHYSFNYIGVLTGPYYRYRTYRDYFVMPFKTYAPNIQMTLDKLKYAGIYGALYLISNSIWPLSYALEDEFYFERSLFYRLMYVWPTFFIFRMRIYTGLTLSECVCTMAGFGAYPEKSLVKNGEGPTEPYHQYKEKPETLDYNFTTIVNTRVKGVETCWTFREGMKHWNICVQYWLAVNVYKIFPSKKYRTFVTLLCSAYWHGFMPGHYFCIMGAPIYVPIEDMWNNLVRKDTVGTKRKIIDIIFWISKFFAFSYMGTAFLLASFSNIWRFYSSVYHLGYIIWALMFALGLYLINKKKALAKKSKQT